MIDQGHSICPTHICSNSTIHWILIPLNIYQSQYQGYSTHHFLFIIILLHLFYYIGWISDLSMQSRFLFSSSEADTLPKTSESISNNFQTYAPNSGPISSNPSSSSLAEEITSRKQIRLDERDHPKQRGDSSSNSYSTGIPVMLFSFS